MANGEDDIKRAIASGDHSKVKDAHKKYIESMDKAGQKAKPLNYFK